MQSDCSECTPIYPAYLEAPSGAWDSKVKVHSLSEFSPWRGLRKLSVWDMGDPYSHCSLFQKVLSTALVLQMLPWHWWSDLPSQCMSDYSDLEDPDATTAFACKWCKCISRVIFTYNISGACLGPLGHHGQWLALLWRPTPEPCGHQWWQKLVECEPCWWVPHLLAELSDLIDLLTFHLHDMILINVTQGCWRLRNCWRMRSCMCLNCSCRGRSRCKSFLCSPHGLLKLESVKLMLKEVKPGLHIGLIVSQPFWTSTMSSRMPPVLRLSSAKALFSLLWCMVAAKVVSLAPFWSLKK